MYKIYVLSSKESQLPYAVEGVKNDLSKEIKWKFIGEVDDYDVAKYMVEHDKCYTKKNETDYWLKHEPCADMRYCFAKIEYNDIVEYYDVYHKTTDSIFKRRLYNMNKEWFLKCLADPFVFNSVVEFQSSVQDGGIIEYDGCGNLLFINKETFQLEEGESCFKDGIEIWKIAEGEFCHGLPNETIERIINHFSDDKKQLIGILWYNK